MKADEQAEDVDEGVRSRRCSKEPHVVGPEHVPKATGERARPAGLKKRE